jgi:xanthine dehydrogenase accessory factor
VHDVVDEVSRLFDSGDRFALATVVGTWSSAPRQPGAAMVVSTSGEPTGSVSGGCVEGAVYELAQEVMASGEAVLQRYGVSDDDAFAVGLTCGGIIDVFVEPVDAAVYAQLPAVVASVRAHEPVAVATVVDGPGNVGAHLAVWADVDRPAQGGLGTRSLTTYAACSTTAQPGCSASARTANAGRTSSLSSSSPSRRRRGCSSSARSTSRPLWRGSGSSSATG